MTDDGLITRLRALSRGEHDDLSIGDEAADVLTALAEALDIIARVGLGSSQQTRCTRWIVARAMSALNGDDKWKAMPRPKGFLYSLLQDYPLQETETTE